MIHPTHCPHVFFRFQHCFSPGLIAGAEIERGRKTIKSPPRPPPCWVHVHPSLRLHEIPLSKTVCHRLLSAPYQPRTENPSFRKRTFPAIIVDLDFSFWAAGREGFLVFTPRSPCVPISFQTVPEWVPRDVPDGTSVLWIWFDQNSAVLYRNSNSGEHDCFHFGTGFQTCASIGGMPHVPKKLLMGPSIWLLEIYICRCTHELIILNHKLLTPLYDVGIDLHTIYCDVCLCTFGKSTTVDETVTAGKGVPSNSTPYCNLMFFCSLFPRFVAYLPWQYPAPC